MNAFVGWLPTNDLSEDAERSGAVGPAFATTHWSAVADAGNSASERSPAALAELCQTYWYPLYVFLRRKGVGPEEAKDLTQSFLADFLERNQFSRANRNLGRFRSFLAASLENFLHNEWRRRSAKKRGGGQVAVSMDLLDLVDRSTNEAHGADNPAWSYERQWARTLLGKAVRDLQDEWEAAGRGALFQEFLAHLWGDVTSVPYPELCARFDLTAVNVRVTFHRFRQRYRELLRRAVADTVTTEAEIDDELRFLLQVVSR